MIAQHPRVYNDKPTKKRSRKLASARKRSLRSIRTTYGDSTDTEHEKQETDGPSHVQIYQAAQIKTNIRPLAEVQSWYAQNGSSSEELQKFASSLENKNPNNGRSLLQWPSGKSRTASPEFEPRHPNYDDVVTDPRWTFSRTKVKARFAESFELLCRNDKANKGNEISRKCSGTKCRVGNMNSDKMIDESKTRRSQVKVSNDSKHKKTKQNRMLNNDDEVKEKIERRRKSMSVLKNEKHSSPKYQTNQRVSSKQQMIPSPCNLLRESGERPMIPNQRRRARRTRHLNVNAVDSSPERIRNKTEVDVQTLFECGKSDASPTSASLEHLPKDLSQLSNRHKYSSAFKSLTIDTFASDKTIKRVKQKAAKTSVRGSNTALESVAVDILSCDELTSRATSKEKKILMPKKAHHKFKRDADIKKATLEKSEKQTDLTSRYVPI